MPNRGEKRKMNTEIIIKNRQVGATTKLIEDSVGIKTLFIVHSESRANQLKSKYRNLDVISFSNLWQIRGNGYDRIVVDEISLMDDLTNYTSLVMFLSAVECKERSISFDLEIWLRKIFGGKIEFNYMLRELPKKMQNQLGFKRNIEVLDDAES